MKRTSYCGLLLAGLFSTSFAVAQPTMVPHNERVDQLALSGGPCVLKSRAQVVLTTCHSTSKLRLTAISDSQEASQSRKKR